MSSLHSWSIGDQLNAADLNGNFNIVGPARYLSLVAAEAITALDAVRIGLYQSDGGISYDTSSSVNAGTSATIVIGSNSNRVLIVIIQSTAGAPAPTFNSVAMTLVTQSAAYSGFVLYTYKLIAPTTGSHSLAWSGTADMIYYSLYNVDQTTPVDASGTATGTGGGVTTNVTPNIEGE